MENGPQETAVLQRLRACNIVDCYAGYAMSGGVKSKSAADVCNVIIDMMYKYGLPRILQTNNWKEFDNKALQKIRKIYGHPYHPVIRHSRAV